MTRRVAPARRTSLPLGDVTIASAAWLSASAGVLLGGPTLWVALVALAIPMVAFVATGHLAGRGAVMACIASALGAGISAGSTGSAAWGAAVVIGLIDVAALIGGRMADRMAPAAESIAEPAAGHWMSIVVRHEAAAAQSPQPIPVLVARTAPMDRTRRHARPSTRSARAERSA